MQKLFFSILALTDAPVHINSCRQINQHLSLGSLKPDDRKRRCWGRLRAAVSSLCITASTSSFLFGHRVEIKRTLSTLKTSLEAEQPSRFRSLSNICEGDHSSIDPTHECDSNWAHTHALEVCVCVCEVKSVCLCLRCLKPFSSRRLWKKRIKCSFI